MNVRAALTAILAGAAIAVIADPAAATKISVKGHRQSQVKRACTASGGLFFPSTPQTKTYGCLNSDGSGIVCGGDTPTDKRTCDTFRQAPPRLPTRSEVGKSEEPGKAEK